MHFWVNTDKIVLTGVQNIDGRGNLGDYDVDRGRQGDGSDYDYAEETGPSGRRSYQGDHSVRTQVSPGSAGTRSYSTRHHSAQTKAAFHLNLKQKNVALSYLRSKKQLETVLDKRVCAAEQLRSVLRGIENAHGDLEVSLVHRFS